MIDGKNKIPKILGEKTETKAKEHARQAAETDPSAELYEITENKGAVLINFRE